MTHDGSGTVDMLNTIAPLRELVDPDPAHRATGRTHSASPVADGCAIVAVPLNLIAAAQYLYATANGGEYMHTVLADTTLLLVAASVALVITTTAGIQVIRRTAENQQYTAGAGATTA